jgi:hypothetical protein
MHTVGGLIFPTNYILILIVLFGILVEDFVFYVYVFLHLLYL